MHEIDLNSEQEHDLIDPVRISNKYAVFSTIIDDPLFWGENANKVIFCGGKITSLNHNVFNFKIHQIVGYISYNSGQDLVISSNMIFQIDEDNDKLIAILPYASYAMKILRNVNPSIGMNILIIGINFFSILLSKLFKLAGANVLFLNLEGENKDHNEIENYTIDEINQSYEFAKIEQLILISDFNVDNLDLLTKESNFQKCNLHLIGPNIEKKSNSNSKFKVNRISVFDKGYLDPSYNKGVGYSYAYIRWDYQRNLKYFISLIKEKIIILDFVKITLMNVNSLNEIEENVKFSPNNSLILFKIHD